MSQLQTFVDAIDAVLPQTQCTKCGFAGCRPYAEAIAAGGAEINQCPPGGAAGIDRLARLTGRVVQPLNPANGVERPALVALIDESVCIGCTKCIQACPVDAIVGASKLMHSVIDAECSGCELCVAPCPVDCISMVEVPAPIQAARTQAIRAEVDHSAAIEPVPGFARVQSDYWRRRFLAREARLLSDRAERDERLRVRTEAALNSAVDRPDPIAAALARAQAKRAALAAGATASLFKRPERKDS
jgi:electron transport complex protein RnfB